jgi:hypothetical protein
MPETNSAQITQIVSALLRIAAALEAIAKK